MVMQAFLLLVLVLLLAYTAWQDFVQREIYWFLFPLIAGLFILNGWLNDGFMLQYAIANILLITVQLGLLCVYYLVVRRVQPKHMEQYLGWGDVLFFFVLTFVFSPLNFFIFYLSSLLLIAVFYLIKYYFWKSDQSIPLAGFQALLLSLLLMHDAPSYGFNLYQDDQLLNLMDYASVFK